MTRDLTAWTLAAALPLVAALGGAGRMGTDQAPATDSAAQQPPVVREAARPVPPADGARAAVPWRVGERLSYEVRFGRIRVGSGVMEVASTADVRGRETYHTVFRVQGRAAWYRVNDTFESWIDTRTLSSLRFVKDQEEGRRDKETRYEIYPERLAYVEQGGEEQRSVANPLDDGSFVYFLRTVPLTVGQTYQFDRYFKPDRNPVTIRVLRRERVKVPAGEFDAVVIQPSIKTKGIFSEGGRAEVWISDDADRVILQMKSSLPFGSLNLYLKSRG
jgi:hypothetical protein